MRSDRQTKRVLGWICALAMLFSALAPSVSHALAAARNVPVPWNAVCTSTGLQSASLLAEPQPGAPADRGAGGHFETCPFCLLHGGADVLPPTGGVLRPAVAYGIAAVSIVPDLPRPQPVRATAQPRAPPSAS